MHRSRSLIVLATASLAVIGLLFHASQGVDATGFRPGVSYGTCDDGSSQAIPAFACTSNVSPGTTLDSVTSLDLPAGNAPPYSGVAYTDASRFNVANDAAMPNGAVVGELRALTTLGFFNGGCSTPQMVDFTLIDATTDFMTAGAVDPNKLITPAGPTDNRLLNLGQDDGDWDNNGSVEHSVSANNGIPDGAEGYPSYLATTLDPDGPGTALPLQPRARYMGVAVVVNLVVILQFTTFEPGALRALVGAGAAASSLGHASLTFLQDPTEGPTNGGITDFCTPLSTSAALDGTTRDNECTSATPPSECSATATGGGLSFTVRIPVENGARAGDGSPCDSIPNECGSTRLASLAVPAGGSTATYLVQTQSLRASEDGDGHENALDPCPLHDDSAWDPSATGPGPGDTDGDGLPDSCDPDDTPGAGFNDDEDGDAWPNRLDNCPLNKNGDTVTSEFVPAGSTEIPVASAEGFPLGNFDIDIGSSIVERLNVAFVTQAPPIFHLRSLSRTGPHPSGTPVRQVFRPNVNHGQVDLDIPFPGVVPEGPRNDNIGPECDTGTTGTEVLSPTVPNGHYHRIAGIVRLCLTSSPAADDTDGDGVCNAQDPNDASTDSDSDSTADGFDNCVSLANTAPAGFTQTDVDWDGLGDACDPLVDADLDGTSDTLERHVGTGIDTVCARDVTGDNETYDALLEDLNDDRSVTGADLSAIAADIGRGVPLASVRRDIAPEPAGDNAITGADLSKIAGKIGTSCSP